jgi:hypothetical protein
MAAARHILLTIALAARAPTAVPADAQTRAQIETASSAPLLDLTTGPDEAIRAAHAAQQRSTVATRLVPPTPAPTARPAGTVEQLVVSPEVAPKPQVVASTDANPLSSPNFSAKDVVGSALSVPVGRTATLGKIVVDNHHTGGFLAVNPSGGPTRSDIGIKDAFATR